MNVLFVSVNVTRVIQSMQSALPFPLTPDPLPLSKPATQAIEHVGYIRRHRKESVDDHKQKLYSIC